MRKTLKSQGTVEQWTVLITLSLEQMKLDSEIHNNTIYGLHKGLQVMKFDITEENGIVVNIDYFDEQDLEDFRKYAAQIIRNPEGYRKPVQTDQPDGAENAPADAAETEPDTAENEPIPDAEDSEDNADEPEAKTKGMFFDDADSDGDQSAEDSAVGSTEPAQDPIDGPEVAAALAATLNAAAAAAAPAVKPIQKKKTWPVVLIIIGVLAVLAATGFLAYRFYQQKQIPINLLSQAVTQYNSGDYESAAATAATILTDYPDSDQANTAQTLAANAQAEIDKAAHEAQVAAQKQAAQSMFAITSQTMTGPDEDGDVHMFFSYSNNYTADLVKVSFGVNFVDATGTSVLIEGADAETVICTDEQGLAAGTALSADQIQNFGPYRNAAIVGFNLVSVEVTYADGTMLTLGSMDEASWVLVL